MRDGADYDGVIATARHAVKIGMGEAMTETICYLADQREILMQENYNLRVHLKMLKNGDLDPPSK